MNEKELRKAYDDEWKKNEPTKYLVCLICNVGAWIPLVIGALQLLDVMRNGANDENIMDLIVWMVVLLVVQIIEAVVKREHNKGWKAYRDSHKNGK